MGRWGRHFGRNYQKGPKSGSNSPQRALARRNYLRWLRSHPKRKVTVVFGVSGSIVTNEDIPITASVRTTQEILVAGKIAGPTQELRVESKIRTKESVKLSGLVLKDGVVQRGRDEARYLIKKLLALWVLYNVRRLQEGRK